MLSILIPIYNVSVTELVNQLHKQALVADEKIEILIIDDASPLKEIKKENSRLDQIECVSYQQLSTNIGRGNIRMLLAKSAKYDTLLFMDCDMRITNKNYLQKFIKHKGKKVVIGGITYSNTPPADKNKFLRWKYGILREKKSASERNKMRFSHFLASNLMISKKIFLSLPVDNDISGYGHEDTLLGLKLLKIKVPLSHIDNALEHLGIDNSVVFLNKSKSATVNLGVLYAKKICGKEIRLINLYEQLKSLRLHQVAFYCIKPFILIIEQNLKSPSPHIPLFDIWKLYFFIKNSER